MIKSLLFLSEDQKREYNQIYGNCFNTSVGREDDKQTIGLISYRDK